MCRESSDEPDHPNGCPFRSLEAMLSHIKAQPEWVKWRHAPLEQRPSLGRNIAKHFHPDKWDEFNSTCDIDHSRAWVFLASLRGKCVAKLCCVILILQKNGPNEFRKLLLI